VTLVRIDVSEVAADNVSGSLNLSSLTMDANAPAKRRSQKTTFFIVTAVKNLKSYIELTGWTL
jgi:hypothetical protein